MSANCVKRPGQSLVNENKDTKINERKKNSTSIQTLAVFHNFNLNFFFKLTKNIKNTAHSLE